MLGWALKKGVQSATGARDAPPEDGDTTQIEVPDTPAPVFAARAISRAIWGTPAPSKETFPDPVAATTTIDDKTSDAPLRDSRSPTKPMGILLTPGTATARRKRVSFGRDVKAGTNGEADANGPGSGRKSIQQRLEESRKSKKNKEDKAEVEKAMPVAERAEPTEEATDDDWEDEICNHDVTVDLNEPHSRSGKYWKLEFSKYSDDARAEMEKLVKYKHLAKCYAQKKDAEAAELNQMLEEEREKVAQMQKQMTEMATKSKGRTSNTDDKDLVKKLSEKTSQAEKYRKRAEDLELLLLEQDRSGAKSQQHKMDTSPREDKTLLETSRELRRARNELKQMKKLQEENEKLKSDRLASDSQRASSDLNQVSLQTSEKQLRNAEAETQRKDRELKRLQKEFDTLKENAKSSRSQALQVLKEKNDRITELEREVKSLQKRDDMSERRIAELERETKLLQQKSDNEILATRTSRVDAALAKHHQTTRDLRSEIAAINKPSIHEKAKLRQPKRAMSAEDLTLDVTQQSLFQSPSRKFDPRFPAEATDDLADIEAQLRQERLERMESRRRDRDLKTVDLDMRQGIPSADRSSKPAQSYDYRRTSHEKKTEAPRHKTRQTALERGSAPNKSGREITRDALDNINTNSRYTARSHVARAPSPTIETPGFDLLQNRFAKLGGPNPNDDTVGTANASRCTLPADRLAAARARIEQKKRQKKNAMGKENMRP